MLKRYAMVAALGAALCLTGCGGDAPAPKDGGESAVGEQSVVEPDFDGSGIADTGAGSMTLHTSGGSTEGGNVPEIAADEDMVVTVGLDYAEGDGSVCDVYVDGMASELQINANEYLGQYSLELSGDALKAGTHKVEVVAMDGDAVTVYKSAEYKVAE